LNLESNSLRNSIQFFWLDNAKLKILFYCHEAGKITHGIFLIDCYFNGFCKGRQNFFLTRYAKKLKSKIFLTTSRLRAMPHSGKLWLPAMRHNAESTHVREFLCEFAIICKNILTCWSVTQVGLIHEKTEGRKSRETVPLKFTVIENVTFFKLQKCVVIVLFKMCTVWVWDAGVRAATVVTAPAPSIWCCLRLRLRSSMTVPVV
jgi:hypothetical protein